MKLTDVTKCKECGSTELSWHTHKKVHNDIPQGRLNSADISMLFVLGCDDCAETLAVINSSKVAELLNEEFSAAPLPQVQSEALDAARWRFMVNLMASAKGSAHLTVNQHLAYYEECEPGKEVSLQWYPDTPVGCYIVEGPTISEVVDEASANYPPATPSGALADNDGGVA